MIELVECESLTNKINIVIEWLCISFNWWTRFFKWHVQTHSPSFLSHNLKCRVCTSLTISFRPGCFGKCSNGRFSVEQSYPHQSFSQIFCEHTSPGHRYRLTKPTTMRPCRATKVQKNQNQLKIIWVNYLTKSYILSRIKMVSFRKGFRFVVCLWWFVNACPRHMVQQKSSTWLAQPDWAAFAGCQPIRRQVAMASALNHHLLPPSCQEKRRLNMSRYVKTFNPTDYNELALRATPLAEPCCL